jgi:SAM-dependent methyltransferase
MPSEPSRYDKAYFDKWYRDPRYRVKSRTDMLRQLRFIVAATEYLLERPVRRVLDIGAGEGQWRQVLKSIRPGAAYYGVDASEYVVRRFGRRRNIRLGSLGSIAKLGLPGKFDLVLCLGVLNYVETEELQAGLRALRRLLDGVAYLELFTRNDRASGDFDRRKARPGWWYRREIMRAGYLPLGMHLYLPAELQSLAAELERVS